MKKFAKSLVVAVLGWQVRRLYRKQDFKVVAVVGSIGKTSTKTAVSRVLSQKLRVRYQTGNYNDVVTVPLIFFGLSEPSLFNPLAWARAFLNIERQLRRPYPYDVVVVEVGTDFPGNLIQFKRYLHADITIVTAVTPEHMEYFTDMDAVAAEELSAHQFSSQLIVNRDLCDAKYLKDLDIPTTTYGADTADYRISGIKFTKLSADFKISDKADKFSLSATMAAVSNAELYSATAAAVVAHKLGLDTEEIKQGIQGLRPVAGRMQRLEGLRNSLIIDETYNASPAAVMAALDSLYTIPAKQKIAILGNMNELGELSEPAHRDVGAHCDPGQLDLVVTIGPDANLYTAAEAKKNGCVVATFDNPYDAGEFVRNRLKAGAVILAKGSQNRVFAEEAVKLLLKNPADQQLLVRQTPEWLKQKAKSFNG